MAEQRQYFSSTVPEGNFKYCVSFLTTLPRALVSGQLGGYTFPEFKPRLKLKPTAESMYILEVEVLHDRSPCWYSERGFTI